MFVVGTCPNICCAGGWYRASWLLMAGGLCGTIPIIPGPAPIPFIIEAPPIPIIPPPA